MPKPLSEHEILVMLVALPLFVGLARLCGEIATRLCQPQVLGELLAGVVLGPSVLGLVWHPGMQTLQQAARTLEPVSWIGIILLLALTGLETDLTRLRRELRSAAFTTLGGVVVPFAGGFAFGMVLPAPLVGGHGSRLVFALFLALAMSISAVTVIAKVLVDLRQMRRTASKIILTGGVFDETLGWVLLALISGLAGGEGNALVVVGKAAAFLAGAALAGRRIVASTLRWVREHSRIDAPAFSATVVLALAFAAVTEALGLHQVLGAFVFGVIASTVPRIDRETIEQLRTMTRGFLVPVFFVFAGLRVDLTQIAHKDVAVVAAAFLAIAILGKLVGCTAGGLAGRMPWREALLVGVGMSARGSMEIVVAVLGLSLGILSPAIFSVIVLLSVVTILIVPSALRFAFRAAPPDEAERARIDREERDAEAYTPNVHRVLVPLLPDASSAVGAEAARALARSKAHASEPLEIVILRSEAAPRGAEQRLVHETARAGSAQPIEVEERETTGREPVDVVGEAMERGYQLLIVGAPAPKRASTLFGPVVNRLLRAASCDVLVVSSAVELDFNRIRRIVVPFTGKESARAAGDLAIALASGLGASVSAISVVRELPFDGAAAIEQLENRIRAAGDAMNELRERAELLEVPFESRILRADVPGDAILRELRARDAELCLLGVTEQSHRGTPFFGDTADLLLRLAPTPVALLVVRERVG